MPLCGLETEQRNVDLGMRCSCFGTICHAFIAFLGTEYKAKHIKNLNYCVYIHNTGNHPVCVTFTSRCVILLCDRAPPLQLGPWFAGKGVCRLCKNCRTFKPLQPRKSKCDVICENLSYGGTKRTASAQNLDFLSYMSICRKHFSGFLHNLKTIYAYKHMKNAYIGKHCLLLHKLGFLRYLHK